MTIPSLKNFFLRLLRSLAPSLILIMQNSTNNNHSFPKECSRLITGYGCKCVAPMVNRKSPFVNHNPENCFHFSVFTLDQT